MFLAVAHRVQPNTTVSANTHGFPSCVVVYCLAAMACCNHLGDREPDYHFRAWRIQEVSHSHGLCVVAVVLHRETVRIGLFPALLLLSYREWAENRPCLWVAKDVILYPGLCLWGVKGDDTESPSQIMSMRCPRCDATSWTMSVRGDTKSQTVSV